MEEISYTFPPELGLISSLVTEVLCSRSVAQMCWAFPFLPPTPSHLWGIVHSILVSHLFVFFSHSCYNWFSSSPHNFLLGPFQYSPVFCFLPFQFIICTIASVIKNWYVDYIIISNFFFLETVLHSIFLSLSQHCIVVKSAGFAFRLPVFLILSVS